MKLGDVAPDETCVECATLPQPISPPVPMADVGEPLMLWRGTMWSPVPAGAEVRASAPGQVTLSWARRPRLRWRADLAAPGMQEQQWRGPVADWSDRTVGIAFADTVSELPAHLSGTGWGISNGGYVGDASGLVSEAVAHWVSLSPLGGAAVHQHGAGECWTWSARADFTFGDWRVEVDARRDLPAIYRAATAAEQCVSTHVVRLRRQGNFLFTAGEASLAAQGLQFAASFALGHWSCLAALTGHGQDGELRWAEWRPAYADPPKGNSGWWNRGRVTPDLDGFLRAFAVQWFDDNERDSLRFLLASAISSVEAGYVEQRLTQAVAAIEMLSWMRVVRDGNTDEAAWKGGETWRRIADLLAAAGISPDLRQDRTPALLAYAKSRSHKNGAKAVAEVRHRVTHPKDNADLYAVPTLLSEASRVALHYLELLVLHHLGYRGETQDRTDSQRWSGQSTPVPWAKLS